MQVEAAIRRHIAATAAVEVDVVVNPEKSSGRSYLTATGSVADTGDIGVVGRGNRANGLITPMRPMSIEAAAGKNPLDHSGKLYTAISQRVADQVAAVTGAAVEVFIATTKERPLSDPELVAVMAEGDAVTIRCREEEIAAIVHAALRDCEALTQEFLAGVDLW